MLNDEYMTKLRRKLYLASEGHDYLNILLISERLLRIYSENKITSGPDYTSDMYRVGTALLKSGRTDKAFTILDIANNSADSISGEESLKIKICNNLAICYINRNDPKKAYEQLDKALKLKKLVSGEMGEEYTDLLTNTGSVLFDLEDYDKAIYYHFKALNRRKEKNLDLADNLNMLGYDFEAKGETENAVNYLEQALEIIKKIRGANSNDYIANVYYLACLFDKSEQPEKALRYYEIVVEKIKETSKQEHPYYAETLGKMANVCVKLENYQRALMLSLKASTIVKKAMGENHIYYANSIRATADIYAKTNDYERAVSLYNEETALKKKILGIKNDVAIKSFIHLSDVYIKCDCLDKAWDVCQNLLKEVDTENVMYFECLLAFARVCSVKEDAEMLYQIYDKVEKIKAELSFDDMLDLAFENDSAENVFTISRKREATVIDASLMEEDENDEDEEDDPDALTDEDFAILDDLNNILEALELDDDEKDSENTDETAENISDDESSVSQDEISGSEEFYEQENLDDFFGFDE